MLTEELQLFDSIDISEDRLFCDYPEAMAILLLDRTTGRNIIWATDNYAWRGEGYAFNEEITAKLITGKNGKVIMPRVMKARELQTSRVREMAEVFTPAWVCNRQNNLVDEAWFGVSNVFNEELETESAENGRRWKTKNPVIIPEGKKWQDYLKLNRLEITCGEAPYLVSRYDVTRGLSRIPVDERIGLLDRKFRIINQMTPDIHQEMTGGEKKSLHRRWLRYAYQALQSIYGFEWQGDNLLLAREAVFMTFIDYYQAKWQTRKNPEPECLKKVAEIISWNLWLMDGLKYGIPGQIPEKQEEDSLLNFAIPEKIPSEKQYCRIREWTGGEPLQGKEIIFADIVNADNAEKA